MIGYSEFVDNEGNYQTTLYCEWFAENVQDYLESIEDRTRLYDGLYLGDFLVRHNNSINDFIEVINQLIEDVELTKIEEEIKSKLCIRLDMANFFMLCNFVNELVREHYIVLLKEQTDIAIRKLGKVEKITFTNKEGETVSTECPQLIMAIMSAIEKPLETEGQVLESAKFGKYDKMNDVVDLSVLQSKFAYYIARFLKEAFPDANRSHRGVQGYISPIEQKLILRMMSHLKLAPKGFTLTTARFRKLMEFYKKLNFPIRYAKMPVIGYVPITCVKYEDWKDKINWFDPDLELKQIKAGDCLYFSPKSIIL